MAWRWKIDEKYQEFENYQKNLLCIRDVEERLLNHMKGQGVSFRSEITEKKGNANRFSQEKLCALVEELLALWAEKLRDDTFTDPATGESLAEPYIRARRELYRSYLYLVMRCSLLRGAYELVYGMKLEERTDFAFLLEQARRIFRSWCVMTDSDGKKRNELFMGYDDHFGFHLYKFLVYRECEVPLTPEAAWPVNQPAFLIDGGYVNRLCLKKVYFGHAPAPWAEKREESIQRSEDIGIREDRGGEDGSHGADGHDGEDSVHGGDGYNGEDDGYGADGSDSEDDGYGADGFDGEDIGHSYDIEDSGYDEDVYEDEDEDDYDGIYGYSDWYDDMDYSEEDLLAIYEAEQEEMQRRQDREDLINYFEDSEYYIKTCELFVEQFQKAEPEVLWRFCEDLEEIVGLYLVKHGLSPLVDTDRALDVYSGIYDGPLRQAERYARGIKWKNL